MSAAIAAAVGGLLMLFLGTPACIGAASCLYDLIPLPAGLLSCVAERDTKPIRNREARVTEPHVA